MGLFGESSKTHASGAESLHDALGTLYLIEGDGLAGTEVHHLDACLGSDELEGVS